jgi:hypothetical protein
MIRKGTQVRIRTENGGDCIAVLASTYRPTYFAELEINGMWFAVSPYRLLSIEPAE